MFYSISHTYSYTSPAWKQDQTKERQERPLASKSVITMLVAPPCGLGWSRALVIKSLNVLQYSRNKLVWIALPTIVDAPNPPKKQTGKRASPAARPSPYPHQEKTIKLW